MGDVDLIALVREGGAIAIACVLLLRIDKRLQDVADKLVTLTEAIVRGSQTPAH